MVLKVPLLHRRSSFDYMAWGQLSLFPSTYDRLPNLVTINRILTSYFKHTPFAWCFTARTRACLAAPSRLFILVAV
jgi:hypothetical protein